jgi:hypothetical protein
MIYLCDKDGFTHHKDSARIKAPGFDFTAYLKSDFIQDLNKDGLLQISELNSSLKILLDTARNKMCEHFRARAALDAVNLVQQWIDESIYPFEGKPMSVVEEVERQIFDVVALNVHEYFPDFENTSKQNKKLQFRLLRAAIETSPEAVQSIIRDVLNLPSEKQKEFADLLDKTSLEAIINASKIISDRLDFLKGLEMLVCDPEWKSKTLERRQLHKIIAEHTWIFGEEFNLSASDRSLTTVLRRHLKLLKKEILDDTPVVTEDGAKGIVDLMLSKIIPQPRADENHHLIIELKRPNKSIDDSVINQITKYALAIVKDDRFRDTNTRWEFWAISNKISETVQLQTHKTGHPLGLLLDNEDVHLKIWVKTWGQILDECRARLRFFQNQLSYESNEISGIEYLQRVHDKYLPRELKKD